MHKKPIAIIGVGNYLMGDEGVGIHAIAALEKHAWPDNVELIDGGTGGISLLHIIEGRELAVIIDCADFGGAPGEIKTFDPDKLLRDEKKEASLHATDLLTVLEMGKKTGNSARKVVIIGVQPEKVEATTSLSKSTKQSLGKLAPLIKKLLF